MSSGGNAVTGLRRCKHGIYYIHCDICKAETEALKLKNKQEPNKCIDIKLIPKDSDKKA